MREPQISLIRIRPRLAGAALLAALALGGCSSDEKPYVERPVDVLYNEAMDAIESKEYGTAARAFEEVERQHPYSKWATRSELMAAYSYYMLNEYDDALVALDRYIQLHPASEDTPYAYYLKALSYYEQISDVERDQEMTRLAQQTLQELTARFPNSKYARDAAIKIDLTYNHLAGKMMAIGRYYLRRGQYLAAINRFRAVVDRYQTTTHVPEALHRLVEAYTALGLEEDAKKAAAVLGHNFPGSEWYIDSYQMVENVRVRPVERSWYDFWSSDDGPAPKPVEIEKDKGPWYKFWGSDSPEKGAAPERAAAKAEPAKTAETDRRKREGTLVQILVAGAACCAVWRSATSFSSTVWISNSAPACVS